MFKTRVRLSNSTAGTLEGIIYAGTIFSVQDPFSRLQNLSAARNTPFKVPAGQSAIVEVESWCLNRSFSPPASTPMQLTSLTATAYGTQREAWDDMDRRR